MNEPKRIEEVLALEEQVRRLTAEVATLSLRVMKPPRKPREWRPWVQWAKRFMPSKSFLFLIFKCMAVFATMLGFVVLFGWFVRPNEPKPVCWTLTRATDAHLWERGSRFS